MKGTRTGLMMSPFFIALCAQAQIQVDQKIELQGVDGTRMVSNLEAPVNGTDAANKDYVDASVSASGGGTITQITDESAAAMNFGAAIRYCHDLTEGGNSDWRLPTHDELISTLSNGTITVANPSSANYIYFSNTIMLGNTYSMLKTLRLSDGIYGTDVSYNSTHSARVRCVR